MVHLHCEPIAGDEPARWLLLTHGIFGSGGNWRSIARKLVERRPEWGVKLVDLRGHGRSPLGDPPYTLAACAEDLCRLVSDDVHAIAGHSFGGKVALAALRCSHPRQLWLLDASPSQRTPPAGSALDILDRMAGLPREWPSRDAFVAALSAAGVEPAVARWLAMNVGGQPLTLQLDLAAMRAMLLDYFATDLWSVIDRSATASEIHVMIATRSATLSQADRERLARSAAHTHLIDADHWLHIEAPDQVVDTFSRHLS